MTIPTRAHGETTAMRRLRELVELGLMHVERQGQTWRIWGRGIDFKLSSLAHLHLSDLEPGG